MTTVTSSWKVRLDKAKTLVEANAIIKEALEKADRPEKLDLLLALHEELVAADPIGGKSGTLDYMRTLFAWLNLTQEDVVSMGMNPTFFKAPAK